MVPDAAEGVDIRVGQVCLDALFQEWEYDRQQRRGTHPKFAQNSLCGTFSPAHTSLARNGHKSNNFSTNLSLDQMSSNDISSIKESPKKPQKHLRIVIPLGRRLAPPVHINQDIGANNRSLFEDTSEPGVFEMTKAASKKLQRVLASYGQDAARVSVTAAEATS
ncbi:hypothetical protein OOU_Y34scaffold00252g9 [Pyricularia oryzae Y34]|uniref:Uncharacterized protein n=1 Tax=Pyricularia oryzae (strain Y34) TaxID=1143189 RepID=A0AA97P4M5_PYRO3|nr:hypothetical protein OOU_Y34scaffold00252g9 [Pyricularia oryzae Y34]